MRWTLIRHGPAEPQTAGYADEHRPLTDRGRQRTRLAARAMRRLLPPPDLLLASTMTRAEQTAELVARAWGITAVPRPSLASYATQSVYLTLLEASGELPEDATLAVVGHEPGLTGVCDLLLAGRDGVGAMKLTKAGVAVIELRRHAMSTPARARLVSLYTGKTLARIGRGMAKR